jgi:drug/metabolite transporter (DMT)-like permease
MASDSLFGAAFFGLASAMTWGAGDFCGGLATRRAPVLTVVFLSQAIGLALLVLLALISREPFPSATDLAWGAAAGIAGVIGLSALYRGMAIGQMGVVASITGVISTALPVAFGALTQGMPDSLQAVGFGMAMAGVWLVSKPQGAARPDGIGLAIVSGIGFGSFLILIAQTQRDAVFWPLSAARVASIALMFIFILARRSFALPARETILLLVLAGVLDAGGNFLFVVASQAGRLDVASALASLYPASTVLLALVLLRERLRRPQMLGVFVSLAAIPLIVAA